MAHTMFVASVCRSLMCEGLAYPSSLLRSDIRTWRQVGRRREADPRQMFWLVLPFGVGWHSHPFPSSPGLRGGPFRSKACGIRTRAAKASLHSSVLQVQAVLPTTRLQPRASGGGGHSGVRPCSHAAHMSHTHAARTPLMRRSGEHMSERAEKERS